MAMNVNGDSTRLRQVLTNLVGNAIKFTEQGEIIIKATIQDSTNDSVKLHFEIKDSGIGIAEDKLDHVFESFAQADSTTTRKYGGTGLGLAITKQLVELMGGEIGIESVPGVGTTFWFDLTLPIVTLSNEELLVVPVQLKGNKVLVVDDTAINREILGLQLDSWEIKNDSAEDAKTALQMLRQAVAAGEPYDIVILDYHMPEMDGMQLARTIKADASISNAHLAMLSSVAGIEEVKASRAAGILCYMSKPVRQSDLFNSLTTIVAETNESTHASSSVVTQQPEQLSGKVLMVEDTKINQEVARSMLEWLGLDYSIANNGREGVDAYLKGGHDVILMDCQMPVMDGFDATAAIRAHEQETNQQYAIPIIALTANAVEGDREKCLAAGMTDYLSKPVKGQELKQMLARWLSTAPRPNSTSIKLDIDDGESEQVSDDGQGSMAQNLSQQNVGSDIIDQAVIDDIRAMQREGSPDLLSRIISVYLKEAPQNIEALNTAVNGKDADGIRNISHALKSGSANIGANILVGHCKELEMMGRTGAIEGAANEFESIKLEFERAVDVLTKYYY
jgi:CheY-like chemotaxis protein/HPt (histidine-containing phosphotransfer) domain-containing protein